MVEFFEPFEAEVLRSVVGGEFPEGDDRCDLVLAVGLRQGRPHVLFAVYELLYCQDIPSKVSINEAIDVGKKFGTEESGAFINGILDSIHIALKKKKIKIETDIQINEIG